MFGEALTEFIIHGGLYVIAATVFIECAFFGGFFLPGDSLLFLAGFIAGQGENNIVYTIVLIFIAAVLGNIVGYYIGDKLGPKLFTKEDGIFFQKGNILRAQQFYEKHGGKTLILARFVPILRTFAPLVAGIGTMTFKRFFTYSTVGAALWAVSVTLTGFYAYRIVGHKIDIAPYMEGIFIAIIAISIGTSIFHAWREKRRHNQNITAKQLQAEQAEINEQLD
jgi:membrane-associated protein